MRPIAHQPSHVPSLGVSRNRAIVLIVGLVLAASAAWTLAILVDDDSKSVSVPQQSAVVDVPSTPMSPRSFETNATDIRSAPMSPRSFETNATDVRPAPMSPRTFEALKADKPLDRIHTAVVSPRTSETPGKSAPSARYDGGPDEGTAGPFAGR